MGLLQRRSVFTNDEPPEPSFKKGRGRKCSMPCSTAPEIDMIDGPPHKELPSLTAAKRKSFANILRPWKKDSEAPPVPPLELPNAPYARGRDSVLSSPTSPLSPWTTRPVTQVGGSSHGGAYATLTRPAYPSSVTLPNFIPGPRRFYKQGGAADSTSSFGASRSTLHLSAQPSWAHYPPSPAPPLNISSPIPGIGDVPATRYNDYRPSSSTASEIGVALASPPGLKSPGKRESRQRIRLSTQTSHTVVTSTSNHSSRTSYSSNKTATAPPPRPPLPNPTAASESLSPEGSQSSHSNNSLSHSLNQSLDRTPIASNRQSQVTIKPIKRQSKGAKRQSELNFLLDAEVAAVFSDSQPSPAGPIPPVPGIPDALAALEGRSQERERKIEERKIEERKIEERGSDRDRDREQSPCSPRAVMSMLPEPRKSKIPVSNQRIQSMMPMSAPRRSSAVVEKSLPPPPRQSFTSLRPPPRAVDSASRTTHSSTPPMPNRASLSPERLPAPASPRPDSLLSTASWGSSAGARISGRGRVQRHSVPWRDSPDMSTGSESEGVEALEDRNKRHTQRRSHRYTSFTTDDESVRSSSSLSHCPTALLSPVSSACDTPFLPAIPNDGMLSPSASGDFGLGLGMIVPGPRNTSPTREIAGLKTRNSALEATNHRLEAELRQARSSPGLRASMATSMYSVSSMVRDDMSIGWTSHNGSCLDLAVPALAAEIDQLKRSGAALHAELQGLKSQVSLLLPPTPDELAETEVRDGYVHGEKYVPSAAYAPPPGRRVHEVSSDADDERDMLAPRRRESSLNSNSDFENALRSRSHLSTYSTSSADSALPLTPNTSTDDWPALPNITELALGSPGGGDRNSIISLTPGGAPLTKLPPRGQARARRIAPVNIAKANTCVPSSDPTTPQATTPKARRAQRGTSQPPPAPRSAVTPRTAMFNINTAVPPPRPPRRRPVAIPRDIVEVAAS